MKFSLTMPPSINQTYGVNTTEQAMYKRRGARDWEIQAGWEIKEQWKGKKQPFKGFVKIGIDWYYKTDRDIDAGLKILLDLLQKQQVVLNDRQFRYITHIGIYPDEINDPRVEVEIDELT